MRLPVVILLFVTLITACKDKNSNTSMVTTGPSHSGLVSNQPDSSQFTTIDWKEKSIDFGKITEGQKLEVVFHFTNSGNKPLVISRVQPSCGCTVAETPTEPVAPGKEGIIKATFDSNDRVGTQHKTLYVEANTKGTQNHELVFEVEVQKKS